MDEVKAENGKMTYALRSLFLGSLIAVYIGCLGMVWAHARPTEWYSMLLFFGASVFGGVCIVGLVTSTDRSEEQ
jgi:hypothetical protein